MPVINFKEISEATASSGTTGLRDTFELFAREFLAHIGFTITSQPSRGPDAGKDLIVEEKRSGVGGETIVRWLVSCKHYATSGKAVGVEDETNIVERVQQHQCDGFLGFYSTLASTALITRLEGLKQIASTVYDCELIERNLLGSADGIHLAKRFFPESIKLWSSTVRKPATILADSPKLLCDVTGTNLLDPEPQGIIALGRVWPPAEDKPHTHYEDVYWCLKGRADQTMNARFEAQGLMTEWEDIPDLLIPTKYLQWCVASMNQLRSGVTYSDRAYKKLITFLITIFPYVARDLTPEERERISFLRMIPKELGGLGG